MANELKSFQARYKKFQDFGRTDAKNADAMVKRIKFFRHDMLIGLDLLEDVVLEAKAGADAIKATKIDDYGDVNKEVRGLLKAIQPINKKLVDCCKDLDKLPDLGNIITKNAKKLEGLKKDVDNDLNGRGKKCKSRSGIEKLQKQIDADMKLNTDIIKTVKGIPKEYYEADNLYTTRVRSIMIAKPKISAKTKKYVGYAPMLKRSVLKKAVKDCQKKVDGIKTSTELAAKAVEDGKSKDGIKHWQGATKSLKELNKTLDSYLVIKRKLQDQINKSFDKKQIDDAMKSFEKIKVAAEKQWAEAEENVKKNS